MSILCRREHARSVDLSSLTMPQCERRRQDELSSPGFSAVAGPTLRRRRLARRASAKRLSRSEGWSFAGFGAGGSRSSIMPESFAEPGSHVDPIEGFPRQDRFAIRPLPQISAAVAQW
jgi:hypothetical protein